MTAAEDTAKRMVVVRTAFWLWENMLRKLGIEEIILGRELGTRLRDER